MKDKLQDLKERRANAVAGAKSIQETAEAEERDLTEDEQEEFDALLLEADEAADAIDELETKRAARERLAAHEAKVNETPKRRSAPTAKPAKIEIPSYERRYGQLKAFSIPGIDAQEREWMAYRSGMFLKSILTGDEDATKWCRDNGLGPNLVRSALSSTTNTAGGYLIPDEMEASIINLKQERGVFRRECMVVPMNSDTLNWPRRTGGQTHYYVGENTAPTESNATFDSISLTARIVAALTRYPLSLAEDAVISIADFISDEMAYAFANAEDVAGFTGDGTSTYGGIFGVSPKADDGNHAGTLYTAASGNTAFSTLDDDDFEGMVGQLPQYAEQNAKWFISKVGFYASMQRLMDAAGGNTIDHLASGGSPQGRPRQFMGYPVVISQVMNAVTTAQTSTAGLAIFGDLRQGAKLGDRRGIAIQVLRERYADQLQIGIIAHQRYDINVHELGDASNAGSLIVLKTPGS